MTPPGSIWDCWTWPLAATARAGELAFRTLGELWGSSPQGEPEGPEPLFATPNRIILDLTTLRAREFSQGGDATPTVVVAPLALHGATMADFAPHHSLIKHLLGEGLERVVLVEWRSATPAMRYLSIDSYLGDLAVVIEDLGGRANLVGLCQGGWLSLMFAGRFPNKACKLVLAGSPIDLDATRSGIVDAVRAISPEIFDALVQSGEGLVLCQRLLETWPFRDLSASAITHILQSESSLSEDLVGRFREWDQWTINLPGTYYLQVVEQLFRHNQLAKSEFCALGRTLDLSLIQTPIYLLAGRDDEVVPPEQVLGLGPLVGTPKADLSAAVAPCGHLSVFMGARTLTTEWSAIGQWLRPN
jgi:poly(3-hydroxybutyrate) depolymerase